MTVTSSGNIDLTADASGPDGFAAGGTAIGFFNVSDGGLNAGAVTITSVGDITGTASTQGSIYGGTAFLGGIRAGNISTQ